MTALRQIFACGILGVAIGVGGCASHPAVPPDASLMTSGTTTAKFKPTTDGRVYVVDRTSGNILYQGQVDRGDVVELNAREDHIKIGGNTVSDRTLDDGHDFEILFKSEPEERTVRYKVVEEEVDND
jgi:hypothetical protein